MATTDISIVSQAMGLIRANPISSFSEGSNEAEVSALFYDTFVQDILTRYPWSFATVKRRLNQDSATPLNEYRYSHILPGECLRLWSLFPSASVGADTIKDYDIQGPDGGRRVFSNYPNLWADYTVYTDEGNWPGYFVQFAIHAFAALVAKPITDQDDIAARLKQDAWGTPSENEQGGKFAVAAKLDAMQKPGEIITASPLIAARFS